MSRGFRDADETQRIGAGVADGAIKQIQAATERQARRAAEMRDRGARGVCEDCGGPIGEDRLEAVPDATRCISCQAGWEKSRTSS
jgi:DnaK suppressor protein